MTSNILRYAAILMVLIMTSCSGTPSEATAYTDETSTPSSIQHETTTTQQPETTSRQSETTTHQPVTTTTETTSQQLTTTLQTDKATSLDEWTGYFSYSEANTLGQIIDYYLYIYELDDTFFARIEIDDGNETMIRKRAILSGDEYHVDLLLDYPLVGDHDYNWNSGDVFLSLSKIDDTIHTTLGTCKQLLPQNDNASQINFVRISDDFENRPINYTLLYLRELDKQELDNANLSVDKVYGTYSLYDIDQNGIPEFILEFGDFSREGLQVYTLLDGNMIECGTLYSDSASILYTNGSKGVIEYGGRMGIYWLNEYILNGTVVERAEKVYGDIGNGEYPTLDALGYGDYTETFFFRDIPLRFAKG